MSSYSRKMAYLSAKIFGEVARPTDQKSMKVVRIFSGKPAHLNPHIVNYYPRLREIRQLMEALRYHGLYRDEHADFKEEMERRRAAAGKVKKVPYHVLQRREREAAEKEKTAKDVEIKTEISR